MQQINKYDWIIHCERYFCAFVGCETYIKMKGFTLEIKLVGV